MPLDLSVLRAKLTELKGGPSRDSVLWKPVEGENVVRIVPLAKNPDMPFTELYFHYYGNKTYISPLSYGESDLINDFADELLAAGGLTKEEYSKTKKLKPQIRTYVPVIDRKRPDLGVRFWAFGKTVYEELLAVMADPDYGDITDPQNGHDIKVFFTPQEKSDTNYAKTAIRVSPKASPLTTDSAQLKAWLTEQPELMDLYRKPSREELTELLAKRVNAGYAPEAAVTGIKPKTDSDWGDDIESTTVAKSKSVGKKTTSDVEDEFAELFGS